MSPETAVELEASSQDGPAPNRAGARHPLAMRVVNSSALILLILILIAATFAALNVSAFATAANLRNIIDNVAILLVVAVGSTFVIATAGIDLSVGSVLVFSGVVSAEVLVKVNPGAIYVVPLGIAICLACGAGWGVLHGFLITKAELSPLIVTLATLGIALGLAQVITGGIDVQGIPAQVTDIAYSNILGIPVLGLIAGGVALAGGVLLHLCRFGMETLAIGSNAEAARRAGINVDRQLIKVYALAGSLSGLAGFLGLSQFATTTIGGHATDVLQVITGVVIGGTSLFGGVATMFGTVVGMLIPGVLQDGLLIVNVAPFWQQVAVGIVLLLAVYLDRVRRRAA